LTRNFYLCFFNNKIVNVKSFLRAETHQAGNCRTHANGGGARSSKGQQWGKILVFMKLN